MSIDTGGVTPPHLCSLTLQSSYAFEVMKRLLPTYTQEYCQAVSFIQIFLLTLVHSITQLQFIGGFSKEK